MPFPRVELEFGWVPLRPFVLQLHSVVFLAVVHPCHMTELAVVPEEAGQS